MGERHFHRCKTPDVFSLHVIQDKTDEDHNYRETIIMLNDSKRIKYKSKWFTYFFFKCSYQRQRQNPT